MRLPRWHLLVLAFLCFLVAALFAWELFAQTWSVNQPSYVLSWSVDESINAPCPGSAEIDPYYGSVRPSFTVLAIACFENRHKDMVKEFFTLEEAFAFYLNRPIFSGNWQQEPSLSEWKLTDKTTGKEIKLPEGKPPLRNNNDNTPQ